MGLLKNTYALKDRDLVMSETPYVLRFRDLPLDEKPRERLQELGPGSLSMAELVAIILSVGTRKEDVMAMARRIVGEYGERALVNETDPQLLADILAIPLGKAQQIV